MVASRRPAQRRARIPLAAPLSLLLAAPLTAWVGGAAAAPAPAGYYQMPFPCGQMWTGTTRSYHSPSRHSVDFNRPDDYRDRVVASAAGTVTTAYSYPSGGYGRWVRIDHGNGRTSLYAHLDQTAVKVGDRVAQGELVGHLGTSGNSSGPHLHYEQREGSRVVPARFDGRAYGYGTTTSKNCPGAAVAADDQPMAGDMVWGKRSELVVYRPLTRGQFRVKRGEKEPFVWRFGGRHAQAFVGDWDGNGRMNPGVRTPWSGRFRMRTPDGLTTLEWGSSQATPVAGDWNGDGTFEVGLHRPHRGKVIRRFRSGVKRGVRIGDADDVAVAGDWDSDGRTDLAVYDDEAGAFTLRVPRPGGSVTWHTVRYGEPGDLPVAGDWNADGRTDLGVWRPSTGEYHKLVPTGPGFTDYRVRTVAFGESR